MAAAGGVRTGDDLYAVLGLNKDCSDADLRNAYKRQALRWHPDRCSASGNDKAMNEAKEKFQEIHQAYSVLSDSNKRFLYDVGVYDASDDDDNGMADFLGEMAQMMSQTKPNNNEEEEKGHESFEELQQLFVDMFQADLDAGFGAPPAPAPAPAPPTTNKRGSAAMARTRKANMDELDAGTTAGFCFGLNNNQGDSTRGRGGGSGSRRRNGRKQKVSSCDAGIST